MTTDIEDVMDAVKAVMVANLNTKIAAIEAAKAGQGKGLTPTLKQVDTTKGYFIQSWSQNILNIDPAVFIEADNPQTVDGGGAVLKLFKIAVYFCLIDSGQTNDVTLRVFRYSRALEELFTNYDFDGFGKVKVDSILPTSWPRDTDSSDEIKIGGVLLTIPLA